jgi:hypothetical protein
MCEICLEANNETEYSVSKEVRNMLARKTSKNQLTLPKEVVGHFPGIDLFDARAAA